MGFWIHKTYVRSWRKDYCIWKNLYLPHE